MRSGHLGEEESILEILHSTPGPASFQVIRKLQKSTDSSQMTPPESKKTLSKKEVSKETNRNIFNCKDKFSAMPLE